jgi:uncharacterized protein
LDPLMSDWVDVFQTAGEDEVLAYLDTHPTPTPENDREPLAIAILRDQIRVADRLLAAGSELGPARGWYRSVGMADLLERRCGSCPAEGLSQALVSAIKRGNGPLQDWLLERAATATAKRLYLAVADGHTIPVGMLRPMPPAEQHALLETACDYGRRELVDALLALGVDPRDCAALHAAAAADQAELIRALVAAGDDPNRADAHGHTALVNAAFERASDAARALLELGADPNLANGHGQTALQGAIEAEDETLAEFLRAAGSTG